MFEEENLFPIAFAEKFWKIIELKDEKVWENFLKRRTHLGYDIVETSEQ